MGAIFRGYSAFIITMVSSKKRSPHIRFWFSWPQYTYTSRFQSPDPQCSVSTGFTWAFTLPFRPKVQSLVILRCKQSPVWQPKQTKPNLGSKKQQQHSLSTQKFKPISRKVLDRPEPAFEYTVIIGKSVTNTSERRILLSSEQGRSPITPRGVVIKRRNEWLILAGFSIDRDIWKKKHWAARKL